MRCHCRRLVVCLCASLETTERFPPREERGRLNREGRMGVRCGATEWRAMRCHCRRSVFSVTFFMSSFACSGVFYIQLIAGQ